MEFTGGKASFHLHVQSISQTDTIWFSPIFIHSVPFFLFFFLGFWSVGHSLHIRYYIWKVKWITYAICKILMTLIIAARRTTLHKERMRITSLQFVEIHLGHSECLCANITITDPRLTALMQLWTNISVKNWGQGG